jgi:hypothetical protein
MTVAAGLGLGSSGCAKKPVMHLNHAEVSGMQLGFPPSLNVVVTVVIDVFNPNSYDVAIRAVRGQTTFGGRYMLPVDYQPGTNASGGQGVWLASDAVTQLRVPVVVPVDLAMTLLRESYMSPSIAYYFAGTADVTATRTFKVEKDNYSVTEAGYIQRQQLEVTIAGMNIPMPR